jgi:O-antigen/teichoic acid export membrane protein
MNDNSRLSNSIKNISFGLISQVVQMILGFVSRTIFIKYLAVEYLGVNGLFSNILSLLSLTELGITSAILYALYKPLAEKDEKKLAALVHFFSKVYRNIALIIAVAGLILVPFLHQIVENPPKQIQQDLELIYLLFLFNTVSSYFLQYKLSLLHADQKSYEVSKNSIFVFTIQNILQILVLVFFQNFIFYLIVQSVMQLSGNLIISNKVNKQYPFLKKYKDEKVDADLKKQIYNNVKATGVVKISGLLVNSTDNIILNYFSGLAMVGLLSNYNLLIGLASGLIIQVFANIKGSIANINVSESHEKIVQTFETINFANFWIYGLATIGVIFLLNDFITIWIGTKYVLPFSVVIALALNFFMMGMQNAVWTFKTTFGIFRQGQYVVFFTALINLALSFWLGSIFGLAGILYATALARLITNTWFDPYLVYKIALKLNPLDYFKKYIEYILVISFVLAILFGVSFMFTKVNMLFLIIKFVICLVITNGIIFYFYRNKPECKGLLILVNAMVNKIRRKS